MKKSFFVVLLVLLAGLWMMPGRASSHREAPLITADPQVDCTDVYAFLSPDNPNILTVISNYIPFEEPAGGPNFYGFSPSALYEIKFDTNGDALEDVTYQFRFTNNTANPNTFLYNTGPVKALDDPNLNLFQTYTVTRVAGTTSTFLGGPFRTMYNNVGAASTPSYNGFGTGIQGLPGGGAVFAGQRDDPFFLDLRVFDLLYGANLSEVADDTLAGFNVHSIVLQIPKSAVRDGTPNIGVWATASRQATTVRSPGGETNSGSFVQVSRLGMPLVNEVVIPVGQKDKWNGSQPKDDGQFLKYVTEPELPKLLQLIYGLTAPGTPRNDLVAVFLTGVPGLNQPPNVVPSEMLRVNLDILPSASEHRLGVLGGDPAGFPNGRRLADDVIDIELRVVAGQLVGISNALGDGVDANDVPFTKSFPYLALPHSGSNPRPHP